MKVTFRNPRTGELKNVKVGWSWTCFLFSGLLGIPLFLRGLDLWGLIMALYWLVFMLGDHFIGFSEITSRILEVASLSVYIFLGIKANEMTAKNYLKQGWEFVDPDSDGVKLAKVKWRITD